jgi:hypothetical protein
MKPDASKHNPDPHYLLELIKQSGVSRRQAAELVGMTWEGFRNYLRDKSHRLYRTVPYTVQFALECLARSD